MGYAHTSKMQLMCQEATYLFSMTVSLSLKTHPTHFIYLILLTNQVVETAGGGSVIVVRGTVMKIEVAVAASIAIAVVIA